MDKVPLAYKDDILHVTIFMQTVQEFIAKLQCNIFLICIIVITFFLGLTEMKIDHYSVGLP